MPAPVRLVHQVRLAPQLPARLFPGEPAQQEFPLRPVEADVASLIELERSEDVAAIHHHVGAAVVAESQPVFGVQLNAQDGARRRVRQLLLRLNGLLQVVWLRRCSRLVLLLLSRLGSLVGLSFLFLSFGPPSP